MKKKFEAKNVIIVSFAHLIHDTYSAFLAPILPLLINKLGITVMLAGLLDIVRKIPALLNPFIGILADRISVRYFIILAPAITAVSMSLLGIAPGYIFVLILVFMAGVGSAIFHVPAPVMIKHVSHNQIGKGMSFYMLGGELARTLGPLLILGAISLWGLEGTYRLIPLGIIATLFLFFRLRKIEIRKDFNRPQELNASSTFRNLLPFFITIAGIMFFRSAMKSALTLYLPTYLTAKGSNLWFAGISLSILQLAGAGGTFVAGIISDKIGRKTSLLAISIINPLMMFLFIYVQGNWMIPILILNGLFLFGSGPVILALIHDLNSGHMSFINGIYMTINFVLSSTMVLGVGFFADTIGLDLTYKICAWLALGSIPFVLIIKNKKEKINEEV